MVFPFAGGGTPPGISYECKNKGVAKFAFRNWMKREGIERNTLAGGRIGMLNRKRLRVES
jgi:hypothetical protein